MKDLISSVVIEDRGPKHAHMRIWNRGGLAGTLIVNKEDANEIKDRLLDHVETKFTITP